MTTSRKRDYAAEYARRRASGAKRGLSLSQARGHARPKAPGRKAEKPASLVRIERSKKLTTSEKNTAKAVRVARDMRKGKSLTAALRSNHMSKAAFNRTAVAKQAIANRTGMQGTAGRRRYTFNPKEFLIATRDGVWKHAVFLPPDRYTVFDWEGAAFKALAFGDTGDLRKFKNVRVRDINGRVYTLLTDLPTLRKMQIERDEIDDEEKYTPFLKTTQRITKRAA